MLALCSTSFFCSLILGWNTQLLVVAFHFIHVNVPWRGFLAGWLQFHQMFWRGDSMLWLVPFSPPCVFVDILLQACHWACALFFSCAYKGNWNRRNKNYLLSCKCSLGDVCFMCLFSYLTRNMGILCYDKLNRHPLRRSWCLGRAWYLYFSVEDLNHTMLCFFAPFSSAWVSSSILDGASVFYGYRVEFSILMCKWESFSFWHLIQKISREVIKHP